MSSKISALPNAGPILGNELIPLVQGSTTKKVDVGTLLASVVPPMTGALTITDAHGNSGTADSVHLVGQSLADATATFAGGACTVTLAVNPSFMYFGAVWGIDPGSETYPLWAGPTIQQGQDMSWDSGNPSVVTINTPGMYRISASAQWPGLTTPAEIQLSLSSADYGTDAFLDARLASVSFTPSQNLSVLVEGFSGDGWFVGIGQMSSAPATADLYFTVEFLGPYPV